MKTTNYSTISPTLGGKALNAMALAAEIAMALICLFMIIWYRLPGVISCLTLTFQIALQILVISVPQYTITLPGIAGLILSAGMAVDANIIISERISEELKKGNSVRNAVKNGYKRAFSSVLDGNVTTAAVAGDFDDLRIRYNAKFWIYPVDRCYHQSACRSLDVQIYAEFSDRI